MPRALPALLAAVGATLCAMTFSLVTFAAAPSAAAIDSQIADGLRWRCIGPFRGGRTVAAVGVSGHPATFYIGVNNGGLWRSNDAGRVWTPLFDDQPTQSIGAIAVAPSDPRVIYVGSGEGLQRPDLSVGDGIYRSDDAGHTWQHLGLRDGQQIPALAVDPRDAKRVFAAVLGHPYGANAERGVFRSVDGGAHWQAVLHPDDDTGAMDVVFDPADVNTLYAVLWAARQAPWEGGAGSLIERNGLFKSTDGGSTWQRAGRGLPGAGDGVGRIGIATVAAVPGRLFAIVSSAKNGGLYRSDDAGAHFTLVNADHRLCDRDGDFNEVRVDPSHPEVIYVANVMTWKSTDGGQHFTGFRGAPGGDDYHRFWIDPQDSNTILLAGDQGAVVTLNGGATWSSWYNQPTAQMFHVNADNHFPYRVMGGQQESGSAGVASRGDDGRITFADWHPVGVEEYGYAVPDPLDADIVYGGKIERFDWRTHDVQNVSPDPLRRGDYRWVRTMPIAFSPADPHALYLAANVVFRTTDGGGHWDTISGDLTRPAPEVPASFGVFTAQDVEHGKHRGVVYALAPSPMSAALLWAGTDDGLIHVTHDLGAHWRDVTPARLTAWSKVSVLEASHFDSLTAYAAINRLRCDDLRPHIEATHDGGRTWTEIVVGIDTAAVVNAVREDPTVRGLLYAATERGVFVTFDDGAHWRSLQRNLPRSSVRDLVVKDADLVAATHGRGFWILDDVTPLRHAAEASAAPAAYLFAPAPTWRVRENRWTDTPLPPDEPAGENPPAGAVIDYRLPAGFHATVTLQVMDSAGAVIRAVHSTDPPEDKGSDLNIPDYWIRTHRPLAATPGVHRFVWDLHAAPLPVPKLYPIAATPAATPAEPRGPWSLPGRYVVRLTAGMQVLERPLEVRADPRVSTSLPELSAVHALAVRLAASITTAAGMRAQVERALAAAAGSGADTTVAIAGNALLHGPRGRPGEDARSAALDLGLWSAQMVRLYEIVESTDAPPTTATLSAATALLERSAEFTDSVARFLKVASHR